MSDRQGVGADAVPQPPRRGVENPEVVDLVSLDRRRGQAVLTMIERRGWEGGDEQLDQLDAKLNAYFTYVLDGHLVRDYPEYDGLPVRLQLDCTAEPVGRFHEMLAVATQVAGDHGLGFVVRVVADEDIPRAPWETPA